MREQEIIKHISEHNEKGLEALLKHYGSLMRYIIAPILPNAQDQEECLSEVAMRVWDRIHRYDKEKGSWNAWLTAVTRNVALNYARKNAGLKSMVEMSDDIPNIELTPEEKIIKKERKKELYEALQALSLKERTLFYRKYYYMQSTAQIASELGMTERAVEGKLYRLKKRLRKMLGGEGDE